MSISLTYKIFTDQFKIKKQAICWGEKGKWLVNKNSSTLLNNKKLKLRQDAVFSNPLNEQWQNEFKIDWWWCFCVYQLNGSVTEHPLCRTTTNHVHSLRKHPAFKYVKNEKCKKKQNAGVWIEKIQMEALSTRERATSPLQEPSRLGTSLL